MRRVELAVEAPRDRLPDRPASRPLPIEAEPLRQPVEAPHDLLLAVTELERADDRREAELALADERLRVDREPRFALGRENVVRVEVLVDEHLLALSQRQPLESRDRLIEKLRLEGTPVSLPFARQVAQPPVDLFPQWPEGRPGGLPEPREKLSKGLQSPLGRLAPEVSPRPAAFEQEGVPPIVPIDETHGSLATPQLERIGFLVALAVRPLDLQDDLAGGNGVRCVAAFERILEPQVPVPGGLLDQARELFFPGGSV